MNPMAASEQNSRSHREADHSLPRIPGTDKKNPRFARLPISSTWPRIYAVTVEGEMPAGAAVSILAELVVLAIEYQNPIAQLERSVAECESPEWVEYPATKAYSLAGQSSSSEGDLPSAPLNAVAVHDDR